MYSVRRQSKWHAARSREERSDSLGIHSIVAVFARAAHESSPTPTENSGISWRARLARFGSEHLRKSAVRTDASRITTHRGPRTYIGIVELSGETRRISIETGPMRNSSPSASAARPLIFSPRTYVPF